MGIVRFNGREMRYNRIKEKERKFLLMAIFILVSAIVLFSVIWDSTENLRLKLKTEFEDGEW